MLIFESLGIDRTTFMVSVSEAVEKIREVPCDGLYVYTRDVGVNLTTRVLDGAAASAWSPTETERWRLADGSGRIVRRNFPPEFVSAGAERRWGSADVVAADVRVVDRRVRAEQYSTLADI